MVSGITLLVLAIVLGLILAYVAHYPAIITCPKCGAEYNVSLHGKVTRIN